MMKITTDFKKLETLKVALQKKILKRAIRSGIRPLIGDVRAGAPVASGALRKSIGSKVDSAKGEVVVYGVVGVRSKWEKIVNGRKKKPSRYGHFTIPGVGKKKTSGFLLPAWNAGKEKYLATVRQVIANEVNAVLSTS